MKTNFKHLLLIVFFLLSFSTIVNAQDVTMADTMRSEGKIYVVVVVAAISLTILSIYLFLIDRKVSKLEKERRK